MMHKIIFKQTHKKIMEDNDDGDINDLIKNIPSIKIIEHQQMNVFRMFKILKLNT